MQKRKITFGFCAVVCVLAWLDWHICLRFLVCALCHELGHLIAIWLFHIKVRSFKLSATGAVIDIDLCNSKTELICASAGPATGVILGFALLQHDPQTAMISFLLSVFNLLPIYPLDGGRMLRAFLSMYLSEDKTHRITGIVAVGMACFLMLLACWGAVSLQMGLWPIFAALILLWKAGE